MILLIVYWCENSRKLDNRPLPSIWRAVFSFILVALAVWVYIFFLAASNKINWFDGEMTIFTITAHAMTVKTIGTKCDRFDDIQAFFTTFVVIVVEFYCCLLFAIHSQLSVLSIQPIEFRNKIYILNWEHFHFRLWFMIDNMHAKAIIEANVRKYSLEG